MKACLYTHPDILLPNFIRCLDCIHDRSGRLLVGEMATITMKLQCSSVCMFDLTVEKQRSDVTLPSVSLTSTTITQ